MRILVVTSYFTPMIGGVVETARALVREAGRLGHDVCLIAGTGIPRQPEEEIVDGITVHRIPFPLEYPGISNFATCVPEGMAFPRSLVRFRRLIRSFRPDVIHVVDDSTNLPYTLLAAGGRVPVVAGLQGFADGVLERSPSYAVRIYRASLRRCSRVIACSRYSLENASRIVPSISSRSCVIPNGVDPSEVNTGDEGAGLTGPYILAIGRLDPFKRFDYLITAFRSVVERHPQLRLVIAGDGALQPVLERVVGMLHLEGRVHFAGRCSRGRIARLLRDCLFLAHAAKREAFGVAVVESMAAGRAVAAFRVGALPEIVEHGETGLLVEEGDLSGFSGAMERLTADAALRNRLGEQGRRVAARYAWSVIVPRYLETFQTLLPGNRPSPAADSAIEKLECCSSSGSRSR